MTINSVNFHAGARDRLQQTQEIGEQNNRFTLTSGRMTSRYISSALPLEKRQAKMKEYESRKADHTQLCEEDGPIFEQNYLFYLQCYKPKTREQTVAAFMQSAAAYTQGCVAIFYDQHNQPIPTAQEVMQTYLEKLRHVRPQGKYKIEVRGNTLTLIEETTKQQLTMDPMRTLAINLLLSRSFVHTNFRSLFVPYSISQPRL